MEFVRVRGARQHNLKNIDVDVPRDVLVVFSGISGSGKSSLAFGTIFAEAQRRYLESVAPYARRLIDQAGVPEVDAIEGLPPAVALQQQRGTPSTRSSVGSVTTISSSLRMLYSRAGTYPKHAPMLYAEDFSANTPQGACPECQGQGHRYEVTEASMVPDGSLTIRERAIAAWPMAWGGQNLRDILVALHIDVDTPWKKLPKKDREWILFTDEQPTVPVYAGLTPAETREAQRRKLEPSYMGTFSSAKRHVFHTFATTQSAMMKKRVAQYLIGTVCTACEGKKLKREALAVKFGGLDIGELSRLPLSALEQVLASGVSPKLSIEKHLVAERIVEDVQARVKALLSLGLGYLTLERSTPTCSPGELQRLRLGTQIRSNLFGVVYVLDEPSAGLHPADSASLLDAFDALTKAGNSVYVVEHDLDVMRHAKWLVDVGPDAGSKGGRVLYSGPPDGLREIEGSHTGRYLFARPNAQRRVVRQPRGWLTLKGVTRNNLQQLDAAFPLGCLTSVTGVSGSGKSSLVSQALIELVSAHLGHEPPEEEDDAADEPVIPTEGALGGAETLKRLVRVDQKPIGRTPRSNLATYTGLFDHVRRRFAETPAAKARRYDAGRFSFNVAKGRCPRCEGEGFVSVEMLFMPSVFAPCPVCHGTRYDESTLKVTYREKNIAQVLEFTVDDACAFFADDAQILRPLELLKEIGLGYLRLGQPATELSGGEAQRIKLATELQRAQRGDALYVLDEPTTGLHPADADRLLKQLHGLVEEGNTVVVVEHEMRVVASSDWVIDLGPGAGDEGGRIVAAGTPVEVAKNKASRTAPYLTRALG